MDTVWVPLSTVLVAIAGAIGTWLIARRKGSGTVKTSEASEIWKANSEFRTLLIEEARERSAENAALRAEAAECHKVQAELEKRVYELERQVTGDERRPPGRHRPA